MKNVSLKSSSDSFSVKFFAKEVSSSPNNYHIHCRVIVNRVKAEFYTNLDVPRKKWNQDTNNSSDISIDDELYNIQSELRRIRRRFYDSNITPASKDIVEVYKGNDARLVGSKFIPYYENCIQSMLRLGELSNSTIKHYKSTLKIFLKFLEEIKKKNLMAEDIDLALIKAFDEYLIVDYISPTGDSITRNTAGKNHSRLKAIINRAIQDGLIERNPYNQFKIRFEKTERDRLTTEELALFENLNTSYNSRDREILDIFLFTCYTGIRYEDAQCLTQKNILKDGDEYSISFKMGKTKEPIVIPVIRKALTVIERYKDRFPNKKLIPAYSNQKFNLYFKVIIAQAGLDRNITHHIGRHTFATIALNNNIPLEVVQKILGHGSIRTTQIYAKMLPKTIREQMKKMDK